MGPQAPPPMALETKLRGETIRSNDHDLDRPIFRRVGDSPMIGAGAYVDNEVGGAAATGDGDVMMRFLPSFVAVEAMRVGIKPRKAAQMAIRRIARFHPNFMGAIVVCSISEDDNRRLFRWLDVTASGVQRAMECQGSSSQCPTTTKPMSRVLTVNEI